MGILLFITVLLIAACGLIYELIAGTLASYLLGDSVFQFSTVIGSYLFAMGVGSYLSRFITRGLVARFVSIELMVGLVGGFSSAALFLAFAYTQGFRLLLYAVVIAVGIGYWLMLTVLVHRYARLSILLPFLHQPRRQVRVVFSEERIFMETSLLSGERNWQDLETVEVYPELWLFRFQSGGHFALPVSVLSPEVDALIRRRAAEAGAIVRE